MTLLWSPVPVYEPDDVIDLGFGEVAVRDLPSCMLGPPIPGPPIPLPPAPAEPPAPAKRRQRKPRIDTLIKQAEKGGKTVTSITLPDGTKLSFDEPEPTEAANPWLADLN